MAIKSGFTESFFDCPDGGSLYFRSYGNPNNQPVLCMHGLTRNANDFHQLAQFLQQSFYVISVDQRGRARSSYLKDPMAYSPGYMPLGLWDMSFLPSLSDLPKLHKMIVEGIALTGESHWHFWWAHAYKELVDCLDCRKIWNIKIPRQDSQRKILWSLI